MPRLAPQFLAQAYHEHHFLPLLLRQCRDLASARLELNWLREHAQKAALESSVLRRAVSWKKLLKVLCHERSKGVPLQYLLGSEFFGELEITCRPGVLIPRQETATAITHLVDQLRRSQATNFPRKLRVLDLCTGSGCIPLLFAHMFPYAKLGVNELDVVGVDISSDAISLAQFNQRRLLQEYSHPSEVCGRLRRTTIEKIQFLKADVLEPSLELRTGIPMKLCHTLSRKDSSSWDIVISNPPYISPNTFDRTTTRSVRNFEPKLALVPSVRAPVDDETQGDWFYPRLLELSEAVDANIFLVEVSNMDQAVRVATMARESKRWHGIEIWRDEPQLQHGGGSKDVFGDISIIGHGHGRSVLCWTPEGGQLMGYCSYALPEPALSITVRRMSRTDSKGMMFTPEKRPELSLHEGLEPGPLICNPILTHLAIFAAAGALRDYKNVDELLDMEPPKCSFWDSVQDILGHPQSTILELKA